MKEWNPQPYSPRGSLLCDQEGRRRLPNQPRSPRGSQRACRNLQGQSNHGTYLPVPTGPGSHKGTQGLNFGDIRNGHVSPTAELISLFKKYFLINYF